MRRNGVLSFGLILLLYSQLQAGAVEFKSIPLDSGQTVVILKGKFEFEDKTADLEAAIRSSGAKIVTFDSGGGNIDSALRIGRAIRSLGVSTIQLRAMECSSACTLAFIGGVNRSAEPGSIGVHRTSFSGDVNLSGHEAAAAVQDITARIMTYMIEMGIDPRLLQLSLSTDSGDMRYLTGKEMQQYNIVTAAADTLVSSFEKPVVKQFPPVARSPNVDEPIKGASAVHTTEDRARKFVDQYHSAWSGTNRVAIAFMEKAYGTGVKFYGKEISHADVLAEKAAFVERWPKRAYSVVDGSERVICSSVCQVSGTVEWFARSSARDKLSSGSARFELEWDPSTSQIVSESGKVIQTDKAEKTPRRIIGQWHDQDGTCRGRLGDDDKTLRACDRREEIGAKLENIGWCYGRPGEYGYQMNWHACQ
ncbi:hypothetical protein [Agrobacterium vitis]|uniref:Uncharacterized protein n=1 Tax=Agrobacterium vitis TaxID=373 RepID=A0A7K1RMJ8_AGRVI|nr:hypothetical protein [Agrobacterium vitis]MVA59268.1 hypothetical protein [Agrobacterium vitis]